MEPTNVRASTDSDEQEEFEGSSSENGSDCAAATDEEGEEEEEEDDEREDEREEEALDFQGQLLQAASPSKRNSAPAASAGAVKPDIVDGIAVLPNLLLAYMHRPLDFMEYSLYEFFCMVNLLLKPKKDDGKQSAAKGQAGPGRPSIATYELNSACEFSKSHVSQVCLRYFVRAPIINSPHQDSPFRATCLKAKLLLIICLQTPL